MIINALCGDYFSEDLSIHANIRPVTAFWLWLGEASSDEGDLWRFVIFLRMFWGCSMTYIYWGCFWGCTNDLQILGMFLRMYKWLLDIGDIFKDVQRLTEIGNIFEDVQKLIFWGCSVTYGDWWMFSDLQILGMFLSMFSDLRRLVIFLRMFRMAFLRLTCRCLVSSWCHSWYRASRWGTCSPPIVLAALFPDDKTNIHITILQHINKQLVQASTFRIESRTSHILQWPSR